MQGDRQNPKRTLEERSPGNHGQDERNPRQRRNGEQEERGREGAGGDAPPNEQSRFEVIDETGGDMEGEQDNEGNGEREREREREERVREERVAEEERERE
jgi:hypothetical protein